MSTEEATERRLEREAQDVCLARLGEKRIRSNVAKVEVTYQKNGEEAEHSGHLIVEMDPRLDPWGTAREMAYGWLSERYPDANYLSVDDIYAY